jgi:dTDP-glucose pyrophosphorylase
MSTYTEAPATATASGRLDRPQAHPNLSAMLLAAGHGTRLAPLTDLVPKPLCPVGNTPMIDMALRHASGQTDHTVVNVHRFRDEFERWCPSGIDLSVEKELLGTAGVVANAAAWVGDDDLLVINSDALLIGDIGPFVSGWDRTTIRLLVTPDPQRPHRRDPHRPLTTALRHERRLRIR